MKTRMLILILLAFGFMEAWACEVCQSKQPKILKNVTHGTGPQDNWDYIITWSAVVIVAVTLFLSAKYLIKPRESNPDHIKRIIVEKW